MPATIDSTMPFRTFSKVSPTSSYSRPVSPHTVKTTAVYPKMAAIAVRAVGLTRMRGPRSSTCRRSRANYACRGAQGRVEARASCIDAPSARTPRLTSLAGEPVVLEPAVEGPVSDHVGSSTPTTHSWEYGLTPPGSPDSIGAGTTDLVVCLCRTCSTSTPYPALITSDKRCCASASPFIEGDGGE